MTLNVNATAFQRVEIIKIGIEIPKGTDQWCHNGINVVDQSVNPVVTTFITLIMSAGSKAISPPMIDPREDEAVMAAVLIKERAKAKAKAKVSIETIAHL
jgi:hypothetical protein